MSIFRKSIIFVHYLAKNVIYINFMMNILDERSISVLHGIWNQNQLHKHLEEKIYKCVISSLYNIIRLFFTPNQDNHFTRRFIYVLSQVFCDQEMCMFIFSIEILREKQLPPLLLGRCKRRFTGHLHTNE